MVPEGGKAEVSQLVAYVPRLDTQQRGRELLAHHLLRGAGVPWRATLLARGGRESSLVHLRRGYG